MTVAFRQQLWDSSQGLKMVNGSTWMFRKGNVECKHLAAQVL
ncbi:MAG: hypothetical protein ACYSTF_04105 [Planctomycetota bacterium]